MRIFPNRDLDKPEAAVICADGTAGVMSMANTIRLAAVRGADRLGFNARVMYLGADSRKPVRAFTTDRSPVLLHAV